MPLFKKWRRRRIAGQSFPGDWLPIVKSNVPYYGKLPPAGRKELLRHTLVFLAEKRFVGCGGLEITDEIRVTIAANACILLLGRATDYYPGLRTILVYPTAYVAESTRHLDTGVVEEGVEVRAGESWDSGSVVLSWEDILEDIAQREGHNVVLHEFAHQLDSSAGRGDSSPVLHSRDAFAAWTKTFHRTYQRLCHNGGDDHSGLFDDYAASDPAEFFAIATEFFFEIPGELQQHYPDLYDQLRNLYQQDPAAFSD